MFFRVVTLKQGSIGTEGRVITKPTPILLNLALAVGIEPLTTSGSVVSFGPSRLYYVEESPIECLGETILGEDMAKDWDKLLHRLSSSTP